jgi:hypothetical protein
MSNNNVLVDALLQQEHVKLLPLFAKTAEMMMKQFDKTS